MKALIKAYYHMRFLIPRGIQIRLRQCIAQRQLTRSQETWPIDPQSALARPPWDSWPDNKRFALVLTHDVETDVGVRKCEALMQLEKEMGFRSSFNFVPERYDTPDRIRHMLSSEGFEVGVHGLLHDGNLYSSRRVFMERAAKINTYLEAWGAVGFRSPSMHHNLDWLHALNIQYDLSTFDTDPFEPDNEGLGTIFPQWIAPLGEFDGYMELPYTLVQDSTLFLILGNRDVSIWKKKLDWIAEQGGMVLLNTHPDYMDFSSPGQHSTRVYPASLYRDFLEYVRSKYDGMYWHALPHEMARFASRCYLKEQEASSGSRGRMQNAI